MRLPSKRVSVVGGGISGLMSIKALKEEGIEPVCFEKVDAIGGMWRYHEGSTLDQASVTWNTVLNHSKEFMFSDFILPKDTSNYMTHFKVHEILVNYAKKFDLLKHILYKKEVVYIKKASDYEDTGRWLVSIKDTVTGDVQTDTFDGVMLCSGQFRSPELPTFHGMEHFPGRIIHTTDLRTTGDFLGQRVVVVGTGCSAMDAAMSISHDAKQVYLSVRTPSWIIRREGAYGLPTDYCMIRRYFFLLQKILPLRVVSWLFQSYIADMKYSHRLLGIEPKYPVLCRDPVVCDGIAAKLLVGSIAMRKNIDRFTNEGVIFEGEDHATEVDSVVLATGYKWNFDFLEEGTLIVEDGRFNLYKCMYPTNLKHPTLALIMFFLPFGPGFPAIELQTRLAAHYLANKKTFPSEEVLLRDAKSRHEANNKRYSPSKKTSVRVDFAPYCDELATELGVLPDFWKMAFTDPKLFLACVFGPCIPSQFRLEGPHKWNGAREAILTTSDRVQTPLSADRLKNREGVGCNVFTLTNVLIPIMITCLLSFKDVPLSYYFCAFIIAYYLINSRLFYKFFIVLFLLPFFFNFHGFVAIYISTLLIFLYFNLGYLLVNRHFWT